MKHLFFRRRKNIIRTLTRKEQMEVIKANYRYEMEELKARAVASEADLRHVLKSLASGMSIEEISSRIGKSPEEIKRILDED